jgi:hypothetical protein
MSNHPLTKILDKNVFRVHHCIWRLKQTLTKFLLCKEENEEASLFILEPKLGNYIGRNQLIDKYWRKGKGKRKYGRPY